MVSLKLVERGLVLVDLRTVVTLMQVKQNSASP